MSAVMRQQQILSIKGGIQPESSGSLSATMRRRQSVSDVLAREMKAAGITSVPELARRAASRGYTVSDTAIKEILRGATKNPRFFTLEAIAVGLNLSPVHFMAELLGDKAEEANFKAGKFAVQAEIYKSMTPGQRTAAEPHIDGLTFQLQRIKNQR